MRRGKDFVLYLLGAGYGKEFYAGLDLGLWRSKDLKAGSSRMAKSLAAGSRHPDITSNIFSTL